MGTRSHCPYCALQCGIELAGTAARPSVAGDATFPVNRGALCLKGWTAPSLLGHPERVRQPLVRQGDGALAPSTLAEALEHVAAQISGLRERHGPDAIGVLGSGSLTNEKAYLLGKFARVALGTANIDYNGRFCMSSAAAAANKAFGIDRGLPFPLEDIPRAEVVLLVGANPADTMPPLMSYFEAQRAAGGSLIVVDPRRTATAVAASSHLGIVPGTDAALANGLLHVLVRDGCVDADYVAQRTEGFAEVRSLVATYWPERVERLTGVPETQIVATAKTLAQARSAMVISARGAEQHAQGVANALAFINVALALGLPGRPASGYGTLTGQGNGQGGREHGQKADQLPGYRRLDDTAAREHMAAFWGLTPDRLPGPGRSAFEMLDTAGGAGGVRALLVFGSNPVVSAPHAGHVAERLRSLDLLVVCDFFLSETARLAHVVLPVAQWAEEEGTTTNLEGRVIRRRRAFDPPPGVPTDLEVLCGLAGALGLAESFRFRNASEVFRELARATAGGVADYAGISYDRIDAEGGIFWPCPSADHPGSPRLFQQTFATPTGRARFHAFRHERPAEGTDRDYPLLLTTGRVLAHYQSGTQTRRVAELAAAAPAPRAELHPLVARQYGLTEGARVRLRTRRGEAFFQVKVSAEIRPDTVFVPFHWPDTQCANRLTNPALDPVSRMPEFKVCAVQIEAAEESEAETVATSEVREP